MWKAALNLVAPWRWWIIAGVVTGCLGLLGYALLAIRSDIRTAAEADAAETINTRGVKDADAVAKGEFDVRDCRARGRVWDLERGRCVDR
jgi:hypothetical protein